MPLRVPLIFNLRRDPYERAQITSNTYYDWLLDRAFLLVPAQAYVGQFLATFKEFPPRQKAGELQPRPGDGAVESTWRNLLTLATDPVWGRPFSAAAPAGSRRRGGIDHETSYIICDVMAVGMAIVSAVAAADPLPSWRGGQAKQTIVDLSRR